MGTQLADKENEELLIQKAMDEKLKQLEKEKDKLESDMDQELKRFKENTPYSGEKMDKEQGKQENVNVLYYIYICTYIRSYT